MALEIKDVKFTINQGYPIIQANIEGIKAIIGHEQKLWDDHRLIFIGGDFANVVPKKVIPADAKRGRRADWEIRGFTDDPQIQALFRLFRSSWQDGTFKEGRVDLGKLEF